MLRLGVAMAARGLPGMALRAMSRTLPVRDYWTQSYAARFSPPS